MWSNMRNKHEKPAVGERVLGSLVDGPLSLFALVGGGASFAIVVLPASAVVSGSYLASALPVGTDLAIGVELAVALAGVAVAVELVIWLVTLYSAHELSPLRSGRY